MNTTGESEATDEDTTERGWVLIRQTPKMPALGLDATFSEIREVAQEEHDRLVAAEKVFDRFGNTWGHTEMIRRAHAFFAAVDALFAASARTHGIVNQSDLDRVRWALTEFARHVADWSEAGVHNPAPSIATTAASVRTVGPVSTCVAISAREEQTSVAIVPDERGTFTLVVLRTDEGHLGGPYPDGVSLVTEASAQAQALADEELLEAENDLHDAGRILMSPVAEVVYGYPALAPAPLASSGTLAIKSIGFYKVAPVMHALEVARKHRRRPSGAVSDPVTTSESGAPHSDEQRLGHPAVTSDNNRSEKPSGADGESPAVESYQRRNPSDASTASEGPTQPPAPEGSNDDPPQPETSPHPAPVDLEGLLNEAITMSSETEERWFAALAGGVDGEIRDLQSRLGSVISALAATAHAHDAVARQRGAPIALPGAPLSKRDANELQVEPDDARRAVQRALALVASLEALVRALAELEQPTVTRIRLPSGAMTSWWSPDAFTRARNAARLALRLADDSGDTQASRERMLDDAVLAWAAGLPEAAALYLAQGLNGDSERGGALGPAYQTLTVIASRLGAGTPVPLEATIPIVDFWLSEVHRRWRAGANDGQRGEP